MREGHLEETLRRIIAEALSTKVKDPRIGFVTINEVRLNRDKTIARVFYTVMEEGEDRRKCLAGLKSSASFLRGIIGDSLRLRTIPRLLFQYDESLDRSFRLEEILEDLAPTEDEASPEDEAKKESES
jgi:ribosome-binding factor A